MYTYYYIISTNIMNCLDIDECTEDETVDCGAHAECYNSVGGYTCVCFNGYEKNEHGQCQGTFQHMCTRPCGCQKKQLNDQVKGSFTLSERETNFSLIFV